MQPDDAIRRVRDAHEGTIENDSQLAHVRQCSARAPSVPSRTADDIHDRALGAFLGLAVGDAVGTTLEFCSRDTQSRLEDMVGGGPSICRPALGPTTRPWRWPLPTAWRNPRRSTAGT